MSLNDKAREALKRELARAFPERAANDPGHDRLAEAIAKPEHPICSYCRERHDPARKFGYTRHGVSSCDMYSSRVAAFSKNLTDDQRRTLGPLFAAAPDLLEACKELASAADAMLGALNIREIENEKAKRGCRAIAAAYNAIARAEGGAA